MAVNIFIKQKGLFKKTVKLSNLKKLAGDKFLVGNRDNTAYVFNEHTDENITNVDIVMQNPAKLGRGFIVCAHADKSVELVLNIPSTSQDIADFYDFTAQMCDYMGTKEFMQDDTPKTVSAIGQMKQEITQWNAEVIRDYLNKLDDHTFIIFGASNPVYIEKEVQDHLRTLEGAELEAAFSKYIDEKQQMDCYYMKPNFYEKGGIILGLYALTEDVDSIIPMKTYIPFNAGLADDTNIDKWVVSLVVVNPGNNYDVAGHITYDDFIANLPPENLTRYDQSHWVLKGLNRAQMDALLQYRTEV